jgi:2-haloacid dehalogenase
VLLNAYHEFERIVEAEKPHRLYKDVLITSLLRAAKKTGVSLSEAQAQELPMHWENLEVFSDVEEMLAGLRQMNCQLGVLTNCDEDLFGQTQRHFRKPFDVVITAERLGSYKPALDHFRRFASLTGATPANWLHVACSWYHDIAPAASLGLRSIWLDRDFTGEDPSIASARVSSASEVCERVRRLFAQADGK